MSRRPDEFATALGDLCSGYQALRPPKRVSVVQSTESNLVVKRPGDATMPWSAAETPYMVQPMNMLASRKKEAVAFAGPARAGKTQGLLLGGIAHFVMSDPGDTLVIHMTQDKAREFSKLDLDRALRHSPKLREMLSASAADRNTHDVMFKHGMWLRIAWPTASNVASTTYRYVLITDLDRMANAENVDGEGPLFALALKRTTTFMSRGMCLVESSPGIELVDPSWIAASPHEAPPVSGILGIYNRGDRRRWYWKCPDCREWFEAAPGLGLFCLPSEDALLEDVRTMDIGTVAKHYGSHIACPHCGSLIESKHRTELNARSRDLGWLADGQRLTKDDELIGDAPDASIASYWLGGVAAVYQKWTSLVERYLQGLREYAMTGSEEVLKATTNTDQGMPYLSMHMRAVRNAAKPIDKAELDLQQYVAPEWTRTLVATVDVQGGSRARFEVQVHAVGEGMESAVIDRFALRKSRREGMGEEFAPIDPASYGEDWDILTDRLLRGTYRTPIEGREMMIRLVVCDAFGEDGVTDKAYAWYRRLRQAGLHNRVMLYKGANGKEAPVIKETLVGARTPREKGDVPLYVCNPHLISDMVASGLRRPLPGPGYVHLPAPRTQSHQQGWVTQAFFDELAAEVRNEKGVWEKVRERNETFDLLRMARAGMLRLGLDKVRDWSTVADWLRPLAENSDVIEAEVRREMQADETEYSGEVAPVRRLTAPRKPARRKVSRSNYLA